MTIKEEFLSQVQAYIHYWHSLEGKSEKEKLEGLAHSMLVMLDGGSTTPAMAVRPIREDDTEGEDIAGGLHEIFAEMLNQQTNNQ